MTEKDKVFKGGKAQERDAVLASKKKSVAPVPEKPVAKETKPEKEIG